jgi:hypothetical protein
VFATQFNDRETIFCRACVVFVRHDFFISS